MSILITGMEMPTDGELLCINIYPDGKVCINLDLDCKQVATAVPVQPHGDLIDRRSVNLEDGPYEYQDWVEWALDQYQNAPTIIPASEEGAKAEEDTEPWLCLSCRHYPPSSTDGKPCSQCNPSEVLHSCYDPVEEGE